MKKLVLFFGALSLISSVAYAKEVLPAVEEVVVVEEVTPVAEPSLRATNFGQYLEVDNTSSGENIGEAVHFANYVGLAYGDDWTFDLMARKSWSMDTHEGIHSNNHRIDLDAWRNFDNFSLGFRFRNEDTYDRYYLRTKYNYGILSGWIDTAYQSNNGASDTEDAYFIETMPIKLAIGPFNVGYYFQANTLAVNTFNDTNPQKAGFEHWYRQQIRFSAPLYQGDKLNIGLEYRWQFDTDAKYDMKYRNGLGYDVIDRNHIFRLSSSYNLTENLNVNGYYQYEMRDWKRRGDNAPVHKDNYYGEFCVGWNYTF